jgi:hypothetical protein
MIAKDRAKKVDRPNALQIKALQQSGKYKLGIVKAAAGAIAIVIFGATFVIEILQYRKAICVQGDSQFDQAVGRRQHAPIYRSLRR